MAVFFVELAIVMVLVFFVSYVMNKIKQPLLIGYIITGLLIGPLFLNMLTSAEGYETFSHIGVAFLLFIVGLHLNLKLVREVGLLALVTGLGQIVFTTVFGIVILKIMGYSWIVSLLIATALTFSSTIIIIKLLTDNAGIDKLYGKISIGFLLIQDLVAVLILMAVGTIAMNTGSSEQLTAILISTVFQGIAGGILVFILGKILSKYILEPMQKSKELVFIFIIAWCLGISVLFQFIGFSIEIGALLAGVALASSPYQHSFSLRIQPLRDFFLVMFFVFLGAQLISDVPQTESITERLVLTTQELAPILFKAIILSLFVLIGNPLIVLILILSLGYSAKTGFLSGLTVSQISEFSIIMALLAVQAGILNVQHVSLITLVAIFTIVFSTYMVMFGERLYKILHPILHRFEKKRIKDSYQGVQGKKHDIIIFGMNRIGSSLLDYVQTTKKSCLVIDHNPDTVKTLKKRSIPSIYGDASNAEFISECDFRDVQLVICTVPDIEANELILLTAKQDNAQAMVIVTASQVDTALELYEKGADFVIVPHFLGGQYITSLIKDDKPEAFIKERLMHIQTLQERKKVLG
ncbi:MAG: cation:proton antiporter [Candidatus Woesearchaeota archaeon]